MPANEWTTPERVLSYLDRADGFPHRAEGESVLLEHVPDEARRVLDLGTGDGRLLALLKQGRPELVGVGVDFSEVMLDAARERFAGDERVELVQHDLSEPLPALGRFDAVISSFAIHHLEHDRKRSLYGEVFDLLESGGVFANFEHVASPTHRLHLAFFEAIGEPIEDEDPSDRTLDVYTQLEWLRALGFDDVDCCSRARQIVGSPSLDWPVKVDRVGATGPVPVLGRKRKGVGMADRVLFISWHAPVRGREERGLEVFNESMGLYGRMQQAGRIENFDVVLLGASGDLNGYIELHGSAEQLAAIREDEEFQRNIIDASLIVDGLRQIEGVTNNEIARQMGLYQESIARVPQIA